jgi:hypothetical protein
MRDDKDTCKTCSKRGYFKIGLCKDCRTTKCFGCGLALRKSFEGQTRCTDCQRKYLHKIRKHGESILS